MARHSADTIAFTFSSDLLPLFIPPYVRQTVHPLVRPFCWQKVLRQRLQTI
jgi:hypothetical protein